MIANGTTDRIIVCTAQTVNQQSGTVPWSFMDVDECFIMTESLFSELFIKYSIR